MALKLGSLKVLYKKHRGAEFISWGPDTGFSFDTFADAAGDALHAAANGDRGVGISVLIYSEAAARWWGGEAAAKKWKKNQPESVVFERYNITVRETTPWGKPRRKR